MSFTNEDISNWRREGAVLLENFFSSEEIAPCAHDMEALYGARRKAVSGEAVDHKSDNKVGAFHLDQFSHIDNMPFNCSPALNLLGLHPELMAMARAALGVEDVYLYQSHSWAKFTGQTDFDQEFHCDFKNHTLTVPSDDARERTINFMIYLTDVTDAHGAIHYVPQSISEDLMGTEPVWHPDEQLQQSLKQHQCSGAAPAGSVFAYGIDVYHRGTNLTAPKGHRYTLTASYKAAGNDMIGYTAWPYSFLQPWNILFETATPEQLACLGVPLPGDDFWTDRTIERLKQRYVGWRSAPYEVALRSKAA